MVQIILVNTSWVISTIRQLIARILWLVRFYRDGVVFNLNCNCWDTIRPCDNRLWSALARNDLPVNWRLWVNIDSVASLTSQVGV